MKKSFLIFAHLFSAYFCFAQSDFKKGYIIKQNGDTIYGQIDNSGFINNSIKCTFISDRDLTKREYLPFEISAYRFIDGKFYISKEIQRNGKWYSLFLEYLINGVVDIYYYRDIDGEYYFVDKGDGLLVELKNSIKNFDLNGVKYNKDNKEYIGVLKYAFSESQSINKEVEKITLSKQSLINISKKYHIEVCSGENCVIYEKKASKNIFNFGFSFSMNYYKLKTKDNQFPLEEDYMVNSNFGAIMYPAFGIFIKTNLPNLSERLFFQYDIQYNTKTLKTTNIYYIQGVFSYITTTFNSINNVGVIKYEFPNGIIRPTIECGGFYDYILKANFNRKTTGPDKPWVLIQSNKNPFSKYDCGFVLGIGSIYKVGKNVDLNANLRYYYGFGKMDNFISNNISFNLSISL